MPRGSTGALRKRGVILGQEYVGPPLELDKWCPAWVGPDWPDAKPSR